MHIPFEELEASLRMLPRWRPDRLIHSAAWRCRTWWQGHWSRNSLMAISRSRFRPHVRLFIQRDPYIVKTATNSRELEAALRLRAKVFLEEGLGLRSSNNLDMDRFDMQCDHLLIIDQRSGKTVGTYRLNSSRFAKRFYSDQEFDLSQVLALDGVKLELGRACIDKDYRTGSVIALLWSGISQYAEQIKARWLFGCASIHTMDTPEIRQIQDWLRQRGHLATAFTAPPRPAYALPPARTGADAAPLEPEEIRKRVPALLHSYLRMGAVLAPEPALDREFHCADFLTVLDLSKLQSSYERRFVKRTEAACGTPA